MKTIPELEKEFYIHRNRILKELNKNEQPLRKELNKILSQVSVLKQKQKQIQLLDIKAKKSLEITQERLNKNKRQVIEDENNVRFMKNRIKQLRREIPVLEKNIREIIPERNKMAKKAGKLTRMVMPLDIKIKKNQERINILRDKIKKLNRKENFIRQGKIVWGEFNRIRKKVAPKKKVIEEKPRKSIFGMIFRR
jgi:chromosome segregation ATPase